MSDENKNETYDIIIFDLMNLYLRGYWACSSMEAVDSETYEVTKTGGIFRALTMFLKIWNQYSSGFKKAKAIFVSDFYWQENPDKDNKFYRRQIDPNYKANRKPMDEEVKKGIPILVEILKHAGEDLHIISVPGYEADDLVKPLCQIFDGKKILIVSKDGDWSVNVKSGKVDQLAGDELITEETFLANNKYATNKVILKKCIRGDSGDGIPVGVMRIREEALLPILNQCSDVEDMLSRIDQITEVPPQWKKKIKESADRLRINSKLVSPLEISQDLILDSCYDSAYEPEQLFSILGKIQLDELKEYFRRNQEFLKE